jgi:predicted dehydrogenase
MKKLKIGVLGAARITEMGIVAPARELGCELYSIAARNPEVAKAFSRKNGFSRYHCTYEELINDPDIDIIYNPLPNGLHGPWNILAMEHGKHVLTEKPFSSNAEEAYRICEVAKKKGTFLMEGIHYSFHPVTRRMYTLLKSGIIGELSKVDIIMIMPEAPQDDPRWLLELAGGALMDLGCYALHIFGRLAPWGGGAPNITEAYAHERQGHSGVDEKTDIVVAYPNGMAGYAHCDMTGNHIEFTLKFTGSKGSIFAKNFLHPHLDDRIVVDTETLKTTEYLGKTYTYTHQLAKFLDCLQNKSPSPVSLKESIATMELIDKCYRVAGMHRRPEYVDVRQGPTDILLS